MDPAVASVAAGFLPSGDKFMYRGNDRWQFQPWWVKVYRWVKFIVPSYPRCWVLYMAGRLGLSVPDTDHAKNVFISQRLWAKHLYTATMSNARLSAGHHYTSAEIRQQLQERRSGGEPTTSDGRAGR